MFSVHETSEKPATRAYDTAWHSWWKMAEASHGYHDIPWTRRSGSSGLLLEIPRDLTASGQDSQDKQSSSHTRKAFVPDLGYQKKSWVITCLSVVVSSRTLIAHEWGIKTTTSSPTYTQSNGQAERFVQTLKGLLKTHPVSYRKIVWHDIFPTYINCLSSIPKY